MSLRSGDVAPNFAFDPTLIKEADLDDLASFFSLTKQECLTRVHAYKSTEQVDAWNLRDRDSEEGLLEFYQQNHAYIWELMQWHASRERESYRETLGHFVSKFPPTPGLHILDFGAGIGTDALWLAERGYNVTLVDVDGPALQFARHRFHRRGLTAEFRTVDSMLPSVTGNFDAVVCFDVFEHLPNPLGMAGRLVASLKPSGVLIQTGTFLNSATHPFHLAKNMQRFGGLRWHCHLVGMGLQAVGPHTYAKTSGLTRAIAKSRFILWRLTGLWIVRP